MTSWNIEEILLFYLSEVLLVLGFNVFWFYYTKLDIKAENKIKIRWTKWLSAPDGTFPKRYLKSERGLLALQEASEPFMQKNPEQLITLMRGKKEDFIHCALPYCRKDKTRAAFFAYLCGYFRMNTPEASETDPLVQWLLGNLTHSSIYLRENSLKSLYLFGNSEAVAGAFQILTRYELFHNRKLVTDGLLTFTGDKEILSSLLIKEFDTFAPVYQVAFVDFFRLAGIRLEKEMAERMEKSEQDVEMDCALIRYFRRFIYHPVKEKLLKIISDDSSWETAAQAALTLGKYPGDDTVEHLKKALCSSNWYVRYNSAQSLMELRVPDEDLQDILEGNDRFAKEQLLYHMNARQEE